MAVGLSCLQTSTLEVGGVIYTRSVLWSTTTILKYHHSMNECSHCHVFSPREEICVRYQGMTYLLNNGTVTIFFIYVAPASDD